MLFTGQTILITGGSGSWGQTLTKYLLQYDAKKIIIFSRGELAQVSMERKFNDKRLEFVIGDVRDALAVNRVFRKNIDYAFHLAALKHVPVCENLPNEAILTNIQGTSNLIEAAIIHKTKKFIDVSTDKAVSPINLYGFTKAVGEKLTIQANNLTDETQFVCIRAGNVLGSNGSVVPHFINQIKTKNEITVTNGQMTRFFLTLDTAIQLIFQAVEHSVGGETYVMNMPSFYIQDLANVLVGYYGNDDTTIKNIGSREGEKEHEQLISEHETARAYILNENYYVILPSININRTYHYENLERVTFKEFSSNTTILNERKLYKLLNDGGFLV